MIRKLIFVAGAGIGYILGTRAGRERYEQMAATTRELLNRATGEERSSAADAGLDQSPTPAYPTPLPAPAPDRLAAPAPTVTPSPLPATPNENTDPTGRLA